MPSTLTTYVPRTGSLLASGGSVAGSILGNALYNRLSQTASELANSDYDPRMINDRYRGQVLAQREAQRVSQTRVVPYREPQPQTPWRPHPRSREFAEEDRRNYEYHRRYSENIQRIYNRAPTQLIVPTASSCCCPSSGHTNKCSIRYRRKKSSRKMTMYRAPKPESHYVDIPIIISTWVNNAPAQVWLLNTIPQGAGVSQRTGKRVRLVSLQIRGSIVVPANSNPVAVDCSMLVVYDKRPTGALPLQTDILTSTDTRGFMNDNNTGRFRVIRRFDFNLVGTTFTPAGVSSGSMKSLDTYVSLKGLNTVFESVGTGGIGDIDSGALYFVPLSNVGTTNAPSSEMSFRVRFTDS